MAETGGQRLLFFGWGAAAEVALRVLREELPDAPALVISHSDQAEDAPLDRVAAELGYQCLLTDDEATLYQAASEFAPTLTLSASYRKKISKKVLALAEAVNFHPSLLPKHRGCFSGFWAIFEGDDKTGVTCHRMVEQFDAGLLLHQEVLELDSTETSYTIYRNLLPVTGACVRAVARLAAQGPLPEGWVQPEGGSYHFRKLPFGGQIHPEWSEEVCERFMRAMYFPGFKGATVAKDGEQIEVTSLEGLRAVRASKGASVAQYAVAGA